MKTLFPYDLSISFYEVNATNECLHPEIVSLIRFDDKRESTDRIAKRFEGLLDVETVVE